VKIIEQRPAEAGSWDVVIETEEFGRVTLHLVDGQPKDVKLTAQLFYDGLVQREAERLKAEEAEKVEKAGRDLDDAVQLVAANLEKLDGPLLDRAVNLVAANLDKLEPATLVKIDTALTEAKTGGKLEPEEPPVKGGR